MTKRGELQNKVFSFLTEYISENDKSPTLAEIAQFLGITPPAVLFHLKNLEKKGLISRTSENRGIVLKKELDFTRIPVLGIANASSPLDNAEESQMGYLQIDNMIIKNRGNLFAVKINGDSMNMHLLKDSTVPLKHGNYVIIDNNKEYLTGDVVLAVVNGGSTLKVYKEADNSVTLIPNSSNQRHHPIYIKDKKQLEINGQAVMAFQNHSIS